MGWSRSIERSCSRTEFATRIGFPSVRMANTTPGGGACRYGRNTERWMSTLGFNAGPGRPAAAAKPGTSRGWRRSFDRAGTARGRVDSIPNLPTRYRGYAGSARRIALWYILQACRPECTIRTNLPHNRRLFTIKGLGSASGSGPGTMPHARGFSEHRVVIDRAHGA
jgi:hypothetical protein